MSGTRRSVEQAVTVGIVGGGPVGLVLAHRLHQAGIGVVMLDRSQDVGPDGQGRAGLWEHRTVCTLARYGLAEGMLTRGQRHPAFELRCFGEHRRVPYGDWAGEKVAHYAYPQQLLVEDCRRSLTAAGANLRYGSEVTAIGDLDTDRPVIQYRTREGDIRSLRCEIVVGADGSRSVARSAAPPGVFTTHRSAHPTSTVAVLAETPSPAGGIIYATGERGLAAHAVRSDQISRLYLQCSLQDNTADWPAARIWSEFDARMALKERSAPPTRRGPILEAAIVSMRSQIVEPLRYRSLFLAGDAGHTIPPMGAKGANLGIADAAELAEAIIARYHNNDHRPLTQYSRRRLADVWRTLAFTRELLDLLCPPVDEDHTARRIRRARLDELLGGGPLTTWFAHRYVGTEVSHRSTDDDSPPTMNERFVHDHASDHHQRQRASHSKLAT